MANFNDISAQFRGLTMENVGSNGQLPTFSMVSPRNWADMSLKFAMTFFYACLLYTSDAADE